MKPVLTLGALLLCAIVPCATLTGSASGTVREQPAHDQPQPQHAPAAAPDAVQKTAMHTGLTYHAIELGGVTVKYAVYVPRDLDLSKPQPAIVFLNGRGECGTDGVRQCSVGLIPAVLSAPDKWPFIIIAPQKPDFDKMWDTYTDHILAALDRTATSFKIDAGRVYLTGLSQGGYGTWRIAATHPERFAAIAPICGWGDASFVAPRVAHLPIWAFHGLKDTVILPAKSRELVDAVKAAQAAESKTPGEKAPEPKLTEFPDADHNSWDNAYRKSDLAAWFLAHTRPGK